MAVDRNQMAELHEAFLAELFGGRKSKNSGATWQDKGDGRNNHLIEELAFAWDGKSTRGKGITIERVMIAKIREEAAGERPAFGLRWYDTDDLQEVGEDWVAITAADFRELLAAARQVEQARDAMARVAEADAMLAMGRQQTAAQGYAAPSPPPPPPRPLHGAYPQDLPVPPHELWPCLVIDGRHTPGDPARMENKGYRIGDDGVVTEYSIWSCRYDTGLGVNRLYVNDLLVPRGMLFIDGVLRTQVGGPQG